MTSGSTAPRAAAANAIVCGGRSRTPALTLMDVGRGRPWLQREQGECAFPVAGEGAATLSCCRPAFRGEYCAAHRSIMFRPADQNEAREILKLVKALDGRWREAEDGR